MQLKLRTLGVILIFIFHFGCSIKLKSKAKFKGKLKSKIKDPNFNDLSLKEELNAVNSAEDKLKSMMNTKDNDKQKISFVNIYEDNILLNLIPHIANIIKCDESSDKSFSEINNMLNNIPGAVDKLKKDNKLKVALKIILSMDNYDIKCRVKAAELGSRIYDIPMSIQLFNSDLDKSSRVMNTYVVMPRNQRIYRPDEYIENFKAGNWEI